MNEDTHLVIHAKDSTRGKDNYLPDLKNCTTWSSLRSTLAQESERSSNARNCGKTEGSGGPGWHRGHRQAPRKPHLLLRLLGGPRAGIPNGPVFRRGGQLLGLPERTRTGAPQVRAAWAARTADTRAPPVYSLLARDEVESLVDQGVEVFHLATRAGSEGEEGGAPRAPHTTRPGHCLRGAVSGDSREVSSRSVAELSLLQHHTGSTSAYHRSALSVLGLLRTC